MEYEVGQEVMTTNDVLIVTHCIEHSEGEVTLLIGSRGTAWIEEGGLVTGWVHEYTRSSKRVADWLAGL